MDPTREQVYITMSGLPGKMATIVAETIEKRKGLTFVVNNVALTGPNQPKSITLGEQTIKLIPPEEHKKYFEERAGDVGRVYEDLIVDFSHPDSVNKNAKLFCEYKMPFVMGTTGGDRKLLRDMVLGSNNYAVIAPNMAKPIVLMQAMFEFATNNFPNALGNFNMSIRESHQSGKADTSGTAKAMVSYFKELGIDFNVQDISKLRDPKFQEIFRKIPKEYLGGHGYHTYTLLSNDKTTDLEITHNIRGRQVYADGTINAINFLMKKHEKAKPGCYDMIDVLKGN